MSCMTIFFYKQVQISRSDIRPHIKWAVSLVILHMVTSIFLQGLCGYIWVNIFTLSPRRGDAKERIMMRKLSWMDPEGIMMCKLKDRWIWESHNEVDFQMVDAKGGIMMSKL